MKKTLFFILLSSICFGQYKGLDSLQMVEKINQIVSNTGKNFVFSEISKDRDSNKTVNYYINPEKEDDKLRILTSTYMEGEDKVLEIKGVKKWRIESVFGNFLTVFPVWQKFSDTKQQRRKW